MRNMLKAVAVSTVIAGSFDYAQAMNNEPNQYMSRVREENIAKYSHAYSAYKANPNPTVEQQKSMFDIWIMSSGCYNNTVVRFLDLIKNIVKGEKVKWNRDYVKSLREAAENGGSSVLPSVCGEQGSLLSAMNSFIKSHPDDWQSYEIGPSLPSKIENEWILYEVGQPMSRSELDEIDEINKMGADEKCRFCLFGNLETKLTNNATKEQKKAVNRLRECCSKIINGSLAISSNVALDCFRAWLDCRIIENSIPSMFMIVIRIIAVRGPGLSFSGNSHTVSLLRTAISSGYCCGGMVFPAIFGLKNSLLPLLNNCIEHNRDFNLSSHPELHKRVCEEWTQIQELLNQ